MKSFLILCLQLGFVAFTMAAIFAVINYLTGWHLGIKGEAVPGDPLMAAVFFIIAGISGGGSLLLTKNK